MGIDQDAELTLVVTDDQFPPEVIEEFDDGKGAEDDEQQPVG
jgi:hypothetical protein